MNINIILRYDYHDRLKQMLKCKSNGNEIFNTPMFK